MNYKDKKVAIIGYGLEGQDCEKFLKDKGSYVTILDQKFDKNYLSNLEKFDLIVRSPGIYPYKKELIKVHENGIRITTPTHIFFDEFNGKVIAVTGTKGKGTTSTLIYEILKKAKFDVFLGGNIGKPLLELLPKLKSSSYVVMEISSFQLIDLPVSPDIAVILNITLDHLDWHESKEEYIEAKKNIVKYQNTSDWAIINKEYKVSSSFARKTKANIMYFSKKTLKNEFKKDLILRGEHNLENIAAAVSVSKVLNINEKIILEVVKNFKGLEHRLEFVRKFKDIKFYNDSFATGPQSTIAAINSFTEDETLILGGSDKGLDYLELGKIISKRKNCKNIILIGLIRNQIKKALVDAKFKGKIIDLGTSSIDKIVEKAFGITQKDGVVILSPAAASFDMFLNYKDRGNKFKEAVWNLS
ncbi:UDP-N-acetylmuramoylalanine--D-glutamate ligase [Candidatus Woesebacteria bacterium RIFOXYC1_FULL_31_51]|uniref:UDP-N-acetylmuramoylalanine--D-glutamate ligase n=1 Tax=Candidatus Woesebacteria bacterium GW2011_GWC2_31_9 TaxID=1618586 RepID=A0A0G0BIZ5_9BACT|nr:MAG: UDP-N-acetylmuramoylalanine--D-glutamate ligase, UDP-N-acetylmuramoylalanine--D-glutamate ligase [Candidatus Woesebacteria bacterium GW2011_GWF1_31_35]KKP23578.1 MAG: UDP-N-acetylmuramoylalanine-D-glutamate ligase [Candidatus Woesebacteria bacterium GW2011_GWC1_30_29]KKP27040.1 MAG: UDP-N-acetylmuramoylalanine-D-glutamate ligase [Candidatus Woesebacteria bacterium GW2011_GWD1_31_12]KKP27854.1 MAG: UDP-N-acetylmuramoylalanine-D-glutamate ligase [Candidatus Woesebacteria bacterium GW2011_G